MSSKAISHLGIVELVKLYANCNTNY